MSQAQTGSKTPSGQPLRAAVLGYGLAGEVFHAPLIASTPGMRVAAIVTANPERAAKARQAYPEARILASADEVWQSPGDYDFVVVASPNRTHVPLGLAALRAGLPVVVDKPVAPTVAGAEELLAESQRTGVQFTVFQNRRWDNDFLTLRRVLDDGLLGTVYRFETRYERWRPTPKAGAWRERPAPEEAGGLLFDLGSHIIDQTLVLFGQPSRVYAEVRQMRPGAQVDDDSFLALDFPSGVIAHLWVSVTTRILGPRFRVLGSRGAFEKYGIDPQEDMLVGGLRPGMPGWGVEPREKWGHLATTLGTPHAVDVDGAVESLPGAYEQFYVRFGAAVRGEGPVPVPPEESLAALRVIEAAQRSAQEHMVVTLS